MYNHRRSNLVNHRQREERPFVRYVETAARRFEPAERYMTMEAALGNHGHHLLSSGRMDTQGILLPELPRGYLTAQRDARAMPDAFDMDFPAEGIPNVLDRAAGVKGLSFMHI